MNSTPAPNSEAFKITYFENASQKVKEVEFSSFEDAAKWGKENLNNFNYELIQKIEK